MYSYSYHLVLSVQRQSAVFLSIWHPISVVSIKIKMSSQLSQVEAPRGQGLKSKLSVASACRTCLLDEIRSSSVVLKANNIDLVNRASINLPTYQSKTVYQSTMCPDSIVAVDRVRAFRALWSLNGANRETDVMS